MPSFGDPSITFGSSSSSFGGSQQASTSSGMYEVLLYDQNGLLSKVLTWTGIPEWEYNRVGGCGQCVVQVMAEYGSMDSLLSPQSSIKISINGQTRYWGKLIKVNKKAQTGGELITLTFYGYLTELSDHIIRRTFTGVEVSEIVKTILDEDIVPFSNITYSPDDIEKTDYSAQSLVFNHSAKDAMTLLAGLAGGIEWGVDFRRQFFFRKTDPNIRRVYVVGREIDQYEEERTDENVVNIVNVFGAQSSDEPLAVVGSTISIAKFNHREANVFESSISEPSDANRLAVVLVQAGGNFQRAIKFRIVKQDEFVEASTPLGATAVNSNFFNSINKYGTSKKYGTGLKYGNINRDQVQNLRYKIIGGGLQIQATLLGDVPNIGDMQKRIEYEVKDLQRR